ncbi:YqjF family protein [Flavobacterium sp. UBA4197]|uniref:YqjF family protein n=1 Tax=Flavobacterium sp. UBA4197 TaxID=1946546 RepID=UPI00257A21F7|nr:DUF2071 domain-containing protein [Flavobacterium sp. UBA4197]
MNFLTAQWKNLIIANYTIDPDVLQQYLPAGTELDSWNNKHYISLIGFQFRNTRVLGIRVPYHVHFDEINLRFYVKRFEDGQWKRGVVFIKEIVPKKAITLIANSLYKEHYSTAPIKHTNKLDAEIRTVSYEWQNKSKWNTIAVNAYDFRSEIDPDTEIDFITEHYFGYTRYTKEVTFEYEVTHPRWHYYPVKNYRINVDFESNYGTAFKALTNQQPESVFFVEGSDITVKNKKKLNHELQHSRLPVLSGDHDLHHRQDW